MVSTIGSILAGTLTYPFVAAVTVLLYVDLRMRREGLDLTLARAAGVAPPDPSSRDHHSSSWGQHPPTGPPVDGAGSPG
jgi:hypothetical protein